MKKSTIKKLTLHRETVRSLEDKTLAQAAGGTSAGDPCQSGTWCNISWCICQ